ENIGVIDIATKPLIRRRLARAIRAGFLIVALAYLGCSAYSQARSSEYRTDPGLSGCRLIATGSLAFKSNGRYKFKITLNNDRKEDIFYDWGLDLRDFSVIIEDSKGAVVPPLVSATEIAVPRAGSHYLVRLAPHEKHIFDVDLSGLYNLEPGRYKVFMSLKVF